VGDALAVIWYAAQSETWLLKFLAGPVINASLWTWDVLFRGMAATRDLGITTFNALAKLWDLAIRPPLVRTFDVLGDLFELVYNPVGTVIRFAEWLVRVPLRQLVTWAGYLRGAAAAVPQVLRLLRGLVVMLASMPELSLFQAAVRARDAFAFFVDKTNLVIDWLNAYAHPQGILREDRLAWTAWQFSEALLAGVVNSAIPEDLDQRVAALLAKWPELKPADVLLDFTQGSPRIRKELDRAIAILRGEAPAA